MKNAVTPRDYDSTSAEGQAKLLMRGMSGGYEVEWDQDAKVTPSGTMVYFAQYLNAGGLLDQFCEGVPLDYKSNNSPSDRDVLGTLLLSILNGDTRYAHIDALRHDKVGPDPLTPIPEPPLCLRLGQGREKQIPGRFRYNRSDGAKIGERYLPPME